MPGALSRDELFRTHLQSPLTEQQRTGFTALSYFPYDPTLRVPAEIDQGVRREPMTVDLPADGLMSFTRIARLSFALSGRATELSLFWINGYGGGLFLPFRDSTNGQTTYGGGRYLIDSIKGADPGGDIASMTLDFNFAYNPSCAYNNRWGCPLSPLENRLALAVQAGELSFTQ